MQRIIFRLERDTYDPEEGSIEVLALLPGTEDNPADWTSVVTSAHTLAKSSRQRSLVREILRDRLTNHLIPRGQFFPPGSFPAHLTVGQGLLAHMPAQGTA